MHCAESSPLAVENLEHKFLKSALLQVGINNDTVNQLAPQAEPWPRAFHKCAALRRSNLELSEHKPARLMRGLPECCFLEAGLQNWCLPPDFAWMGSAEAFLKCASLNGGSRALYTTLYCKKSVWRVHAT